MASPISAVAMRVASTKAAASAPTVRAIILTPLSPHTMSVRPLVVDAEQTVGIRVVAGRSKIVVTIDGQDGCELEGDQHLEIKRSSRYTHLVVPEDYDFFALLREKL